MRGAVFEPGFASLRDRSSPPHRSPRAMPRGTAQRMIALRPTPLDDGEHCGRVADLARDCVSWHAPD